MADGNSEIAAENPASGPPGRSSADERAAVREKLRAERLATALRENLKRRKAQARGRVQTGKPGDPQASD